MINRIIHGRLEIWNLSSRVHVPDLTRSLRSLVRYLCGHSKINSISPCTCIILYIFCSKFSQFLPFPATLGIPLPGLLFPISCTPPPLLSQVLSPPDPHCFKVKLENSKHCLSSLLPFDRVIVLKYRRPFF